MNTLESKAIDIIIAEHNTLFYKIDNIKHRIKSVVTSEESKTNIVSSHKMLIDELESLLDKELHSMHEWLHALKNNKL